MASQEWLIQWSLSNCKEVPWLEAETNGSWDFFFSAAPTAQNSPELSDFCKNATSESISSNS